MSPTQTPPRPSGAIASTSVGSSSHTVVETVRPSAGSTANRRPVSPESLVVTTRSPTTASPLDSMISPSWKVNATCAWSAGTAAAPRRNGTATSPASSRSANGVAQELGQPGTDPPGVDQVGVLPVQRAALDRRAGAGGPQQRVAG